MNSRTVIPPAIFEMIENLLDSGWGDEEIRRELEIYHGAASIRFLDLYYLELAQ